MLIKAALFAALWAILPYGWFAAAAILLYLVPFFQPWRMWLPFLVLLLVAGLPSTAAFVAPFQALAFVPPLLWPAALLGLAFMLILGIKDLVLVKRESAFEVLILLLLFSLFINFFSYFDSFGKPWLAAAAFGIAVLTGVFIRELVRFSPSGENLKLIIPGAVGFLTWQWMVALTFLPLNYFHQTALLFLGVATAVECVAAYGRGELDRRKILAYFSVFFAVFTIILAANSWTV